MRILIDSSVYISHFGLNDKYTQPTKNFFKKLSKNISIIIPVSVLLEIINVLSKHHKSDIKKIVEKLSAFDVPELNIDFARKFKEAMLSSPAALKTSDAIIAITAKVFDATLITWDKKLLSPDQKYCRAITPAQFISKK